MNFTYLDLVDPTILFEPIMARNCFIHGDKECALFAADETKPFTIPGYHGTRCIIEVKMAEELARMQKELLPKGLSLTVYDAYRPQKAVDFFTQWSLMPDTPLAKKHHYPNVDKKDFDALSYLSRTSSHSKGTAVDLTLVDLNHRALVKRPEDFLGHFDAQSVDMGVGYLCFDEKSWHSYSNITDAQKRNRATLLELMISHGFEPLDTEFWHYYFKPERNKDVYYNFDVRDDYIVDQLLYLANHMTNKGHAVPLRNF